MIDPVVELAVGFALALLFAAAAWHKVSDRVHFGATVNAYDGKESTSTETDRDGRYALSRPHQSGTEVPAS